MARQESDRDDLFAEIVALKRRLEGTCTQTGTGPGAAEVVLGLRDNGWFSVYCGPDPVYHFDGQNRLRRAYVDGLLYRTQGNTLARLQRSRSETETSLLRYDLTPAELQAFRHRLIEDLQPVAESFASSTWTSLRRFPEDDSLLESDFGQRLAGCLNADPWLAPSIPGRRV